MGTPQPLAQPLHQALMGAVFPLTAEQLTWVARENEAPAVLLTLLGSLPRGRFGSVDDVAVALEQGMRASAQPPATPPRGP